MLRQKFEKGLNLAELMEDIVLCKHMGNIHCGTEEIQNYNF